MPQSSTLALLGLQATEPTVFAQELYFATRIFCRYVCRKSVNHTQEIQSLQPKVDVQGLGKQFDTVPGLLHATIRRLIRRLEKCIINIFLKLAQVKLIRHEDSSQAYQRS